jgi:hypothetical protein
MEKLVSGNYTAAAIQFALGAVMKIAQAQLEQVPYRLSAYNAQIRSGGTIQEATNAANSGYHLNLKMASAAMGRNSEEIQAANDIIASHLKVDMMMMSKQAAGGGGIMGRVSNIANTFGVSMEDSAKMYANVTASYRRNGKAKDEDTKVMEDFTKMNAYGTAVYKSGYSTMSNFKDQVLEAYNATNDYSQSLGEVSGIAESISKIKGVAAVNPSRQGQAAGSIISSMQNMSPAMIMALTGGGLASAWDWNTKTSAQQLATTKGGLGGLLNGDGKDSSGKQITSMLLQSLMGMDARTSKTMTEIGNTTPLTAADLKPFVDSIAKATQAIVSVQGDAQNAARYKDIATALISSTLGNPINVKLAPQ